MSCKGALVATKKKLLVAVYWFGDKSYGGSHSCDTWKEAEQQADLRKRLGYDNPGVSEVRIIQQTSKVYRYAPAPTQETEL